MEKTYQQIITINPTIRGGKPIIRGLRYTVYDILSYLAAGMSVDEIIEDFPDLTRADIQACLSYAADRERRTSGVCCSSIGCFVHTQEPTICSPFSPSQCR